MGSELNRLSKQLEFLQLRAMMPTTPTLVPPDGADFVHMINLTDVPAATSSAGPFTWTQAATFKVQESFRGVVRQFALDTNNPAGEMFVRFRFTINGAPGRNYQAPPANIGDVDDPDDVYLALKGGDVFAVELTNLDTTIPYRVTTVALVWAWRIPTALEVARLAGV